MPLPSFNERPNEKIALEPEIISCLKSHALDVVVLDGRIDLLIRAKNDSPDRFLELKVCLSGEGRSPPLSSEQWHFIKSIECGSAFDSRYRVLIYDHNRELYALVSAPQIAAGLQDSPPDSTCYISASCLKELPWSSPLSTELALLSWVGQCR